MSAFVLHAKDAGRDRVLANCLQFLQSLPADKPWQVSVEKYVKPYSGKQRRSIFGAAYKALMEFSGLEGDSDKRELHAFMCRQFFGKRTDAFGREVAVRTTTRNERGEHDPIGIDEALRFYAFLQREGAQVGCYVPDPDPFWREKAEKEARASLSLVRQAA